jgi:hypothetical protein
MAKRIAGHVLFDDMRGIFMKYASISIITDGTEKFS